MYTIENDLLHVSINAIGAELSSVYNKGQQLEYLWSGDPKFWGKKSPVLFPIIGTLKNNNFIFNSLSYELGRHGFARDKVFDVTAKTSTRLTFTLNSDEASFRVFPFHFTFSITYELAQRSLSVNYNVKNNGPDEMYFSVGGHPAFKVPISDELSYEDYYLLFNKVENADRWPITKEGLIGTTSVPLLVNTDRLHLSRKLFYEDAIVFKHLQSDEVQLKTDKDPAGIRFNFKGFPYLGIWAAKGAPFVCIEPWCGIADSVNTTQDIKQKEGIICLEAGKDFGRTWSISISQTL